MQRLNSFIYNCKFFPQVLTLWHKRSKTPLQTIPKVERGGSLWAPPTIGIYLDGIALSHIIALLKSPRQLEDIQFGTYLSTHTLLNLIKSK